MGKPYSQDLRDRVIAAVEDEGMSCRAAARRFGVSDSAAVKWLQRYHETGSRTAMKVGGHRRSRLAAHRDFLAAVRAEQPDITLEALGRRLGEERGVKADTSMLSRFFRREGITHKKRRWRRASGSVPTSPGAAPGGASTSTGSTRPGWSSSTKPGPRPT